ncbi:hypothetical protein [Ketobacter sp.]|nr:MAG: hypothetical protein D6160_14535 [Ketobacter sp.]
MMKKSRLVIGLSSAVWLLSGPVFALPPEIETDRLVLAAEEKLSEQNFDAARDYLQRVSALKTTPAAKFYYLSGLVSLHYGELDSANQQLSQYVEKAGREAPYYEQALNSITAIEEQKNSRQAASSSREQMRQLQSGGDIAIEDSAGKAYDQKIQSLYLASDLSDALVLHINSLLSSYVYLDGKVKNLKTSDREEYSLAIKQPAQILVTKKSVKPALGGQSEISVTSQDAFGINPFISFRCSSAVDQCEIKHPVSGDAWMVIANDETAAEDIAKALTRLIKSLQR